MSDNPKQPTEPPPLPLHLVRPWTAREKALRHELEKTRADLEAQSALVEILRNQPTTPELSAQEDTLPGIGAIQRAPRTPTDVGPIPGQPGRRKWALIVGAVIGLAAAVATLRYPGLMGPIEQLAKTLSEALQQ